MILRVMFVYSLAVAVGAFDVFGADHKVRGGWSATCLVNCTPSRHSNKETSTCTNNNNNNIRQS